MKYFKQVFSAFLLSSLIHAMDTPQSVGDAAKKEKSVQDFLNSKPNYQLIGLNQVSLERHGFTSLKGIENVDRVSKMEHINCDDNCIRLDGTPFNGFACRVITLNRNGLTAITPSVFSGANHLTQLSLASNEISALPADWGPLHALTYLNLRANKLKKIPAGSFEQLTALTTLDLDNNDTREIDLNAGELPKLICLSLKGNFTDDWIAGKIEEEILADRNIPFSYKHIDGWFYVGNPENLDEIVEIVSTREQP